jgi:exonuclease SbcC
MKILRLSLKNLNSFGRAIDLDFASPPLSETPLLAITGPTGSGKTTLLDAISVSLYNKTPRLSGKEQNNPVNLLRQGEKEGYAEVLFEVRGRQYLARWEATRDRKGNIKPDVKLIDAVSEKLITERCSDKKGARELEDFSVEEAVSRIIGLDFASFNRSVMLAQGEFAAFLKADKDKKRDILQHIAGLDIYEHLKDTLTLKVKSLISECESAEKAFAQFAAVTEKQVEEEERRQNEIAEEICSLRLQKSEISARKEEETKRSETYKRLSERKAYLESLIARQSAIEETERTLKSAQRAARARIECEACKTEEANKSQADRAVTEASGKLSDAVNEAEEHAKRLDEAEKALSEFMKKKDGVIESINTARIEETKAGERQILAEETGKKLSALKAEADDRMRESIDLEKAIGIIIEQIEGDESFLRDNKAPPDADRRRDEGASILSDLEGARRNLKDSELQQKKKAGAEEELVNKLAVLKAALSQKETASEAALKNLEKSMKARDSMLAGGSVGLWEQEKARAASLQTAASDYEHKAMRAEDLEKSRDGQSKAITSLHELHASLLLKKDAMTQEVISAEKQVAGREKEKEQALIAGNVALLRREHLLEGEPCPVCGSVEHPWKKREIREGDDIVSRAQNALDEARRTAEKHRWEMGSLEKEIARCESEKAHAEAERLKTDSELQDLKSGMDDCAAKWRSLYPDSVPSVKYLCGIIESNEKRIKEYIQAERIEMDSKSALDKAEAEVVLCRTELSGLNEQLSVVREELEELTRQIETHHNRLKKREQDFLRVIPARYHRGEWELSLNSFRDALDEISERRKRLSSIIPERERAAAKLDSLQSIASDKDKEISSLEKRQEELREEEKALRRAAMDRTDGLGSNGAAVKLESEQKKLEVMKDTALRVFRNLEEARIRLHAELEQRKSHLRECIDRNGKASELYMKALEREGFASQQEHESAFRDDEWLERSSSEINTYREDLRSTENHIRELENTFAERAYDADELNSIKTEEENLEGMLGEKLRGEGGLKETIARMKEDLQKQKETGAMFENLCRERDRWIRLQKCIKGNELRDFALDSVFSHLLYLARQQMLEITHRYELKAGRDFRITVLDRWNGCLERPVETLSGGETFLVSLSLALALSDLSRGHAELDSLFLDEGFGTLDSDTLEVVMATLEKLHLSGKKITLISHIHDLTRRIPVRIAVKRQGEGSSTLSIEGE